MFTSVTETSIFCSLLFMFSIEMIHCGGLFLLFYMFGLVPSSRLALLSRKGLAGQYSVSGFLGQDWNQKQSKYIILISINILSHFSLAYLQFLGPVTSPGKGSSKQPFASRCYPKLQLGFLNLGLIHLGQSAPFSCSFLCIYARFTGFFFWIISSKCVWWLPVERSTKRS